MGSRNFATEHQYFLPHTIPPCGHKIILNIGILGEGVPEVLDRAPKKCINIHSSFDWACPEVLDRAQDERWYYSFFLFNKITVRTELNRSMNGNVKK